MTVRDIRVCESCRCLRRYGSAPDGYVQCCATKTYMHFINRKTFEHGTPIEGCTRLIEHETSLALREL